MTSLEPVAHPAQPAGPARPGSAVESPFHAHPSPFDDTIDEFEGVDPVAARVFQAYMQALNVHRLLIVRAMASEGAHPGQAFCLRILARSEGISQRDLAERMHLAAPTVTTMLQKMEKAGIVVRRSDEVDQRLTRVTLTDGGRRMAGDVRRVLARTIASVLEGMSEADRLEFERLLRLFAENASRALEESAP